MHYFFLKRTLLCFASNDSLQKTPNESKYFNFTFLCNLCVLSECFWSQNVGKRSTTTEIEIQWAFWGNICRLRFENGSKLPGKVENVNVFADFWHFQWFFISDLKLLTRWKLRKAPGGITRFSACFSKRILHFSSMNVSSEWPKIWEKLNFQVFCVFYVQFLSHFLEKKKVQKNSLKQLFLVCSRRFWRCNCNLSLELASEAPKN